MILIQQFKQMQWHFYHYCVAMVCNFCFLFIFIFLTFKKEKIQQICFDKGIVNKLLDNIERQSDGPVLLAADLQILGILAVNGI